VGGGVRVGRVDGLESEGILSVSLVPELGLWREGRVLLAEEVSEVGDGVIGVANEEVLGLSTVILVAINVRENGGNLSVYRAANVSK
jgi:hypothetical protein